MSQKIKVDLEKYETLRCKIGKLHGKMLLAAPKQHMNGMYEVYWKVGALQIESSNFKMNSN